MRTSSEVFVEFISTFGSKKEAAEALGCSYALICHIANGVRSVSRAMAERASAVRPQFTQAQLLLGDEERAA